MMRLLLFFCLISIAKMNLFAQVLGPVIYNCDFANGIPQNWDTYSESGISHWEYRGPNTTPDVNTGARGTCALLAQPMASITQSNGFVIFDSNYWDDGGNSCGGLGTGVDPAPHNAYLELPPLDLSAYDGVILTFQQQFRHYLDSNLVEISLDGGNDWSIAFMNNGAQSGNVEWVNVNLSTIAAGYSDVRVRFRYSGLYYWWLLDDIALYVPFNNDLRLNTAKYTTNQGVNGPAPFHDLEYDQYPTVMIPAFNFSTNVSNIGAFNQNNCYLNCRIVQDGVNQIYNQNSSATNIVSGTAANLSIAAPFQSPAVLGDYDIFYTIDQFEEDDNPENNFDTLNYTISPFTYARDEGPCASIFTGLELFEGYRYEAGNHFQSRGFGRVIHAVGVAIAEGTPPGTQIKATIYKDEFEGVWAESEVHTVNYAELNQMGDEKIVVLPLITPLTTFNDSIYIAMVGALEDDDDFAICRSGVSPEATSILRIPGANSLLYFGNTPVVRLHIFSSTAIPGCNKPDAVNYDPLATIEDGSCRYPGCAHADADNYDESANWDDGSCIIGGCMDPLADNFHEFATYDNGGCQYLGCTDELASNFDPEANTNDGSCLYVTAFFQVNVQSGCAPLNVQITNQTELQASSQCTYEINGQELTDNCLSNFEQAFNEPGTYDITYTHTAGEFTSSYTVTINVLQTPPTPVVIDNDDDALVCLNCGTNDLIWFINNTEIPNETNDTLVYFDGSIYQNGEYEVQVSNAEGCISQSNGNLVFVANLASDITSGCAPAGVVFTNLTTEISNLVCNIQFGDNTGSSNFTGQLNHVYELPGTYTALLTCGEGLEVATSSIDIYVGEPVEIDVYWNNVTEQVVCANPGDFELITWYYGDTQYVGPGPFDDEVGLWTVVGQTAEGCVSSADATVIHTDEFELNVSGVYPNPVQSLAIIQWSGTFQTQFELFDATGRLVWASGNVAGGQLQVDWSNLPEGMYQLKANHLSGQQSSSVVIMR
jgi:PKD repeat protein